MSAKQAKRRGTAFCVPQVQSNTTLYVLPSPWFSVQLHLSQLCLQALFLLPIKWMLCMSEGENQLLVSSSVTASAEKETLLAPGDTGI